MSLVNPVELIREARTNGRAIAAFNIHNMETVAAVAECASDLHYPVILQTTPGTVRHAGAEYIVAMASAAARLSSIPVALNLDHCTDINMLKQCVDCGYTSVMMDASRLPYAENVKLMREAVEYAHNRGVAVEGELGRIGGVEDGVSLAVREAAFTVPAEAAEFVDDTGIDTLAVAIGTAHGEYKGVPDLDFERLAAIRALVEIPLVLHGASGVPDYQIYEAIRIGVAKINYATQLKIPMAQAIKDCFAANPRQNDPRVYMGAAKKAVYDAARVIMLMCARQSC